jgi:hypothetical protein
MSGAMVFGAIAVTEQNAVVVHGARRVPVAWVDRDNSLWKQQVSSRFAPAPADSGSWQTYSSVLTPPEPPETRGSSSSSATEPQVKHAKK